MKIFLFLNLKINLTIYFNMRGINSIEYKINSKVLYLYNYTKK